ncbi:hypothetical protein ACE1B6_26820 [Aerosakkonemataceae cyanobacterium BLCC-F154]|uniref:Uncharacterized protein n=1 Tax=Floridaenema fluviatile BLCC-F154 TaxID=3153640 RepID=A0ABV4YJ72_9CYAN
MASEEQVKQYIAYWFQLGKRVLIRNGREALLPQRVIQGDRYSDEFGECWQRIIAPDSGDCYLEGTQETIAELLTPTWDLNPCARCSMPIPVRNLGLPPNNCPCSDLPTWPNLETPLPRSPVDTQVHLNDLISRLLKKERSEDLEQSSRENLKEKVE